MSGATTGALEVRFTIDDFQLEKIMKLPLLVRHAVGDKCLKAMTKPVIAKAKSIAPSSRQTGTRNRWGRNKTEHFDPTAWAQDDSGKNVASRVIKTAFGAIVFVGFTHPQGNKQQFNQSPKGRKVFYWGKDAGVTRPAKGSDRIMQRAFDETKPEQLSAFNAQLEIEIKRLNLG